MQIASYWRSFVSILFPPLCVSCDSVLLHQEEVICTACRFHFPLTDHFRFFQNELTQRMAGKAPIVTGAAYLSYTKSSAVQAIVHKLKYKAGYEVGRYLGEELGMQLRYSPFYKDIDIVVPMPLHRKKKHARGYNQSGYIAEGIAAVLSLPMNRSAFIRTIHTDSQTKKSRMERYDNVEHAFRCVNPEAFENKHVLLVDDVLTTGATMASAVHTLTEQCPCKVSLAVLAIA